MLTHQKKARTMPMDREKKLKKPQRNTKKQITTAATRSPLQDLNGVQIPKISCKNKESLSSNPTSSSSSSFPPVVSVEASKCCIRFMCSANSSSSSSSSRVLPSGKLKSVSKLATTNYAGKKSAAAVSSKVSSRSKENDGVPLSGPFSDKSTTCLDQRRSGKNYVKPASKGGQRSKLLFDRKNPTTRSKKRPNQDSGVNIRISSREDGSGKPFGLSENKKLNFVENPTPSGKIANVCGLNLLGHRTVKDCSILETVNENDSSVVKTPPIEASLSPEIENGSHSKILIPQSGGTTPVCYGAGHHLSGVTDKRKCRRIGSLKGGFERANLFDSEGEGNSTRNVVMRNDSGDFSVPLLAGASVRWRLSPCDEVHEDEGNNSDNWLNPCRVTRADDASVTNLDLLSLPSSLCGNASDSIFGDDIYLGRNKRRDRIVVLSPREDSLIKKIDEHVLVSTTPDSIMSIGSLSSGNVIQTPNSDSSSDQLNGGQSNEEVHQRCFLQSELDLVTKTLEMVSLSPTNEMSMRDASSNSFDANWIKKSTASLSSWVSDSMLENLSLSQMRISWRDGLENQITENDEFDRCRCLSDEEVDRDECSEAQLRTIIQSSETRNHLNSESPTNKEGCLSSDGGLYICPQIVESKAFISTKNKERLCSERAGEWAESISTNGGGLVASGDSDWSHCFENDLFLV